MTFAQRRSDRLNSAICPPRSAWSSLPPSGIVRQRVPERTSGGSLCRILISNRSLFTQVFADGLRHLEPVQSGFSKSCALAAREMPGFVFRWGIPDWLQLFIGYDLPPLLWVWHRPSRFWKNPYHVLADAKRHSLWPCPALGEQQPPQTILKGCAATPKWDSRD
jgi:hypothetical protein